MKLLIAIPHYYDAAGGGQHGSLSANARPRIEALTACVGSLRHTLSSSQHMLNLERRLAQEANQSAAHSLKIVICTTRGRHILDRLPLPPDSFTHVETQAEPKLLGFECHRVLRESLGQFDYYGYMEDDLILHDPWFFDKLRWFDGLVGGAALLQPNRYEAAIQGASLKVYVDGDIRPDLTAAFQNRKENPALLGNVLGRPIRFVRPANPHSGCFFLTANQMAHWAAQSFFLDRDTSFIGPLESAATLGMMRTFHIYKPAPENADFFQIQHAGTGFLRLVGGRVPIAPPQKAPRTKVGTPGNAAGQQTDGAQKLAPPYRFGWDPFRDINRLSKDWHYPIRTFFDVGANDGQTVLGALQAFRNCQIVAFEPHAETCSLLKQRFASSQNVEVVNLALGSEQGKTTMFEYENSHINSLASDAQFAVRFDKAAKRTVVDCTTLDKFCEEQAINEIDVLKIDTEGFEYEVLKGARGLLEKRSIRFVYFEFNTIQPKPGTTGGALAPIDELLQEYGYRFIATYNDWVMDSAEDPFVVSNAFYVLSNRS